MFSKKETAKITEVELEKFKVRMAREGAWETIIEVCGENLAILRRESDDFYRVQMMKYKLDEKKRITINFETREITQVNR